jgi:hypothetical protein
MPAYSRIHPRSALAGSTGGPVSANGRGQTVKPGALMVAALSIGFAALAPLVPGLVWAQEASFRIVSDGTAKYSYTEEPGWETLDFDDADWPFVVAPSGGLCDASPVPPGAPEPIWGEDPREFQTLFVRKTFTLEAAATALVVVGVDDDYDLFINGAFIGGNHDGFAGTDRYTDVPLQEGLNVIAIMAVDSGGGCQSVSFDISPPPEPPANDDVADAIVIPDLDFTDTRDTRGATTAPDDPGSCWGGTNVWYVFTPKEDTVVRLTTAGSTYEASLDVFVISAGRLSHITCGFVQLDFVASAGTTYYIMVSSPYTFGGDLTFSAQSLGTPFQVILHVDDNATFDWRTGTAAIQGSVLCNQPARIEVNGQLRQKFGRKTIIQGSFNTSVDCDGETPWNATVRSDQGAYGRGAAEILASAYGCALYNCDDDPVTTILTLRRKQ